MTLSIEVGAGKPKTGSSKIGGNPDLPSRLTWPTGDWEPLAFLFQLNLAEIHAAETVPGLPARGMVYVFCTVDEGALAEPDPETALLFSADVSGLSPRAFPKELDDVEGILEERALRFVPGSTPGAGLVLGALAFQNPELSGHFDPKTDLLLVQLRAAGALARKGSERSIYGHGVFHLVIARRAMERGRLQETQVLFEQGE
jgi:hypothetical protein